VGHNSAASLVASVVIDSTIAARQEVFVQFAGSDRLRSTRLHGSPAISIPLADS